MINRSSAGSSERVRPWTSLVLLCLALFCARLAADPSPEPGKVPGRTLHVVVDDNYPPFLFRDLDGALQGYLVDYWELWSRRTGVAVKLEATNWAQAQRTILSGHADVIDMLYRTPPRQRLYDFSAPYADLPASIFHHASITGITSVDTLRGFRVGVMEGDACIHELAVRGITNLALYPNYTELIQAAVRQDVKVFCLDEIPGQFYLYRLGVQQDFRNGFRLYTGQFHRAVRKGDAATLDLVQRGMAAISEEEDAALRKKWFGAPLDVAPYARAAGGAALGVVLVGGLLLLWNVSLRRKVRQSTLELRQAFDELREANRAERESRQNLKAALDAIPDPLFEIDADGRYVNFFVSDDALLAWPRETLLGQQVAAVLPSAAAEAVLLSVTTALEQGSDFGRTIQLDLPGGPRWFELSSARKEYAIEGQRTVMMVSRDVTQRFEAERELASMRAEALASERDRVFRMLFESSPVAMVHARGNVIESVNRQFTRLFGWDGNDLHTLDDWWRLAYPDPEYRAARAAAWAASWVEVAAGNDVDPRDVNVTCADGVVRRILIAAQKVGESVIVSFVDVTERNRTEAALRAAKQAAEQASLAKTSFLANMSHEIRTPLNGIIGMAYLIRESGLSAEQAQRLAKLEAAADHLLHILSAILDLSKIEAGKFVLEARPLRLEAVVTNTIAVIEERARAKGLNIVSEVEGVPCALLGDAVRLQQALLNFADNAVKFSDRGSVTFRVRRVHEDASCVLCRFEVADTGVGIEPAALLRLFGSFEQADVSTTRRFGGTGLGLAITKGLAELMGGEAGVDSAPGVGSTFWFTATLRKGVATHAPIDGPVRAVTESAAALLRQRHPGGRVLIAEDNEINAVVATSLLRKAGLTVDLAVDGLEAVSKATTSDYALVLMDVQMPNMDGLEAARCIRAALADAPPIIAMTANAFAENRAECLAAGMSDFLGKPVEPQQMYATVLKWLGERSVTRDRVPATGEAAPTGP
jgi:two-component system, sensor histidine kinase and response regulator